MPHHGPTLNIPVSEQVLIWDWLFTCQTSALQSVPRAQIRGFRDAQTGARLDFASIARHATSFSNTLHVKYGLKAGDNIAIACRNSIWYPVAVFAALRLGIVVTAVSHEYGAKELEYAVKTAKSKIVIVNASALGAARTALEDPSLAETRLVCLDEAADCESLRALVEEGSAMDVIPSFTLQSSRTSKEIVAFLSLTSGTTGLPKAVMISHRNIIAQAYQVFALTKTGPAQTLLGVLPLCHSEFSSTHTLPPSKQIVLTPHPLTGLVHILHLPLLLNQEVVLLPNFTMKSMLDAIVNYSCQELWLVPPLLIRLLHDPLVRTYDLTPITQFNTGAAPLAPEIIKELESRFPTVAIRQAWGMTESCSCLTLTPPAHQTYANAHTVGKIVPGTVLKIVDTESGREVPDGTAGEILAAGPQITLGYLQADGNAACILDEEGYLHTGDLGSVCRDGFVTILDRLKELIKVKGVGVAPAELEDVLLGHPDIADAAVVGKPDAYAGEVAKAFVVLRAGASTTEGEVQAWVRRRKARPKWVTGGVEFVEEIPKSASGKILRRVLRDREKERYERRSKL